MVWYIEISIPGANYIVLSLRRNSACEGYGVCSLDGDYEEYFSVRDEWRELDGRVEEPDQSEAPVEEDFRSLKDHINGCIRSERNQEQAVSYIFVHQYPMYIPRVYQVYSILTKHHHSCPSLSLNNSSICGFNQYPSSSSLPIVFAPEIHPLHFSLPQLQLNA